MPKALKRHNEDGEISSPPGTTETLKPDPNKPAPIKSLQNADEIKYLVTDADNNLWDWVGMHAKGMQEMCAKLTTCTGIPFDRVRDSMKRVYSAAKTLDYSYVVESMDVIQEYAAHQAEKHLYFGDPEFTEMVRGVHRSSEIVSLVEAARKAYDANKNKVFELYPGVKDLFKLIGSSRIQIVILTDAPNDKTIRRLKQFGLHRDIAKMFGQERSPLKYDVEKKPKYPKEDRGLSRWHDAIREALPYVTDHTHRSLVGSGRYEVPFPVVIMKNSERKPDVDLAARLRLTPEQVSNQVVVWGDNPDKDVMLAIRNNCAAFYSDYGQIKDPRVAELLRQFGSTQVVSRNLGAGVDRFNELKAMYEGQKKTEILSEREALMKILIHQSPNARNHVQLVQLDHSIQAADALGLDRPKKYQRTA